MWKYQYPFCFAHHFAFFPPVPKVVKYVGGCKLHHLCVSFAHTRIFVGVKNCDDCNFLRERLKPVARTRRYIHLYSMETISNVNHGYDTYSETSAYRLM